MKRIIAIGCLFLSLTACGKHYSDGERVGIVTKLSQKGLIWDSWEGEMLIALPIEVAGQTQPEKFRFNVDPSVVSQVEKAMKTGNRVTLVYRQWFIAPPTIDNQYVIIEVK